MRTGTLTAASVQLGVGLATLSRRIERLEDALGVTLFVHLQSGYQLTEDGAELVPGAEALEAAALGLRVEAKKLLKVAGLVRLATAENLATNLILPEMRHLRTSYPDLTIEFVTDISTVNLHRRDADLALRMVKPERGNVTLQRLGTLGYGLYGTPELIAARLNSADVGNYDEDAFIGWSEGQSHLPSAQWVNRILQSRAPAVTTTSLSAQLAAAKAGLGLAVLPHFLARDAGLTCIHNDLGIDQTIYLVTQFDLSRVARIKVVADFLRNTVQAHKDRLSGR